VMTEGILYWRQFIAGPIVPCLIWQLRRTTKIYCMSERMRCVCCAYSDGLRAALGLKPNELPPYIYQMRVVGYPPGHLQNARQETSGLAMFGKQGLGESCIDFKFASLTVSNQLAYKLFLMPI